MPGTVLKDGDRVIGRVKNNKDRLGSIIQVIIVDRKPTYTVKFDDGPEMQCSNRSISKVSPNIAAPAVVQQAENNVHDGEGDNNDETVDEDDDIDDLDGRYNDEEEKNCEELENELRLDLNFKIIENLCCEI